MIIETQLITSIKSYKLCDGKNCFQLMTKCQPSDSICHIMGTRNTAFHGDDEMSRNEIDEIPSISKNTHNDGAQLTRFVSLLIAIN